MKIGDQEKINQQWHHLMVMKESFDKMRKSVFKKFIFLNKIEWKLQESREKRVDRKEIKKLPFCQRRQTSQPAKKTWSNNLFGE